MTKQIRSATAYHQETSYRRHFLTPHHLDWANQPVIAKHYPQLPRVPLDRSVELPEIDYFSMEKRKPGDGVEPLARLDIPDISRVFRLTHDITARAVHGGKTFYYRSVASAGALYPFELYMAAHDVHGLQPGVYHFDLFDFSLTAVRQGVLSGFPPARRNVAAAFFISGIFFRSAWKYRSRAYRYVLLDAGHLMENLRLALQAMNRPFSIHLDFEDDRANNLLGVDPQREACLAAVLLYGGSGGDRQNGCPEENKPPGILDDGIPRASTVSNQEVRYPSILQVHQAGRKALDGPITDNSLPAAGKGGDIQWHRLEYTGQRQAMDYTDVLRRRRSHRNFIPGSISTDEMVTFLCQLMKRMGKPSGMPSACQSLVTTGLLMGEGAPMGAGFYLLDPEMNRLGRVSDSLQMESMAKACLDQMWLKHAAFHLLFITDLATLDRDWGPRGYRYAMIEAGRMGQQAYLTSTAMGWGACGIGAIYDREAANLLNLKDSEALLYLVGLGPIKKRKR